MQTRLALISWRYRRE